MRGATGENTRARLRRCLIGAWSVLAAVVFGARRGGLSNKEIAAELGSSVCTIEGLISSVLPKKGFGNRVETARHVLGRVASG